MSSEVRVVRPYVGVDRFQAILDGWRVRIGPDEIENGHRATLPASNYTSIKPVLVTSADDEGAAALRTEAHSAARDLELTPDDIELLIIASTPFLRLADVALRVPLSASEAFVPELVLGTESPLRALEAPSGGCDIEVFFCLADHFDPRPLAPSRKGTWLGRARFTLRTELGELGFTPVPLTVEKRKALGLHADTIRFVNIDAGALMSEQLSDVVELYLDEKLLAITNQAPNSPAARSFQRQLYLDVMAAIVRDAGRDDEVMEAHLSDLEGRFLGRVIETAANRTKGMSETEFKERCEDALNNLKKRPELFMAALEARITPREDLRLALGGDS